MRWRPGLIAAVVAPWLWFLLDDLGGTPTELIGLALPAIGVAAVVLALGLSVARRTRLVAVPLLSLALVALVATVMPWRPHDSGQPRGAVDVVAANVQAKWDKDLAGDIIRQDADIVVVSELSPPIDERLTRAYLYQSVGEDLGVYSRLPVDQVRPVPFLDASRARAVTIAGPDGPFVLLGVHMPRPAARASGSHQVTYARHQEIISELADWIDDQELPVVLAGDLNISDRGPSYHRLTDVADDAMRAGWAAPTSLRWPQRLLLLRLDHILAPEAWCWADSGRFVLPGSDHRGVRATVGPCG